MAGRNTSKILHESNLAHMVRPFHIEDDEWYQLENLANYKFTEPMRQEISHQMASIADWRDMAAINMQSIKRTLQYISKLSPDVAETAYLNCDFATKAYIDAAAHIQLGADIKGLAGETISNAARIALSDENILPASGGRPTPVHRMLADYCCELWMECGNTKKVYQWGEAEEIRLLDFAEILFNAIGSKIKKPTILELLQKR